MPACTCGAAIQCPASCQFRGEREEALRDARARIQANADQNLAGALADVEVADQTEYALAAMQQAAQLMVSRGVPPGNAVAMLVGATASRLYHDLPHG